MSAADAPRSRTIAAIALGANLGEREKQLASALRALERTPGVVVLRRSEWIETDAVGGPPDQPRYLNGAALLETTLASDELLARLLEIEAKLGRVRPAERDAPRPIDLDLLFFGDEVRSDEHLTLPHPRLAERLFVLEPLAELCPDRKIAGLDGTVAECLAKRRGAAPETSR